MKGIERRVVTLEKHLRPRGMPLSHLSDQELDAAAIALIGQFGREGVSLPSDWRDQYEVEPDKFLNWLGQQAGEMVECAV